MRQGGSWRLLPDADESRAPRPPPFQRLARTPIVIAIADQCVVLPCAAEAHTEAALLVEHRPPLASTRSLVDCLTRPPGPVRQAGLLAPQGVDWAFAPTHDAQAGAVASIDPACLTGIGSAVDTAPATSASAAPKSPATATAGSVRSCVKAPAASKPARAARATATAPRPIRSCTAARATCAARATQATSSACAAAVHRCVRSCTAARGAARASPAAASGARPASRCA